MQLLALEWVSLKQPVKITMVPVIAWAVGVIFGFVVSPNPIVALICGAFFVANEFPFKECKKTPAANNSTFDKQVINKLISILLLFTATTSSAFANDLTDEINRIPLNICSIDRIHYTAAIIDMKKQGFLIEQSQPFIEEMKRINNKAKDKNTPIKSQLEKKDIASFDRARKKFMSLIGLQQIESNYTRDNDIIYNLTQVAIKNYKGIEVNKNSSQYIYQDALELMRSKPETPTPQTTNESICSMNLALQLMEIEALDKLDLKETKEARAWEASTIEKYHMKEMDRSKLSDWDRYVYDDLDRRIFTPVHQGVQFTADLENIKIISEVADLVHDTLTNDINHGLKPETTIHDKMRNGEISEDMMIFMIVLRDLGDKIPSEMQKIYRNKEN